MSDSSETDRADAYGSKGVYSRPEVFERYDEVRFTSYGGRLFDRIEKGMLLSSIPESRDLRILECGTGTGRFAAELGHLGYSVTATDVSPGMLEQARQRIDVEGLADRVEVRHGDIYGLEYDDASFDFVFTIRVLNQLVKNDDKRRAIEEMVRVLAPGGLLLFDIINRWSLAILKRASWHISPLAVRGILRQSGCKVTRMTGGLIFTQTLLEILPRPMAAALNVCDRAVCRALPCFATRVYFLARKST